jgi:hypothetical protein
LLSLPIYWQLFLKQKCFIQGVKLYYGYCQDFIVSSVDLKVKK